MASGGKLIQRAFQVCCAAGALVLSTVVAASETLQRDQVQWAEVRRLSEQYVEEESPSNVWPFERPNPATLSKTQKKVFSHYFGPFPLSDDNLPASNDYFTLQFLKRGGEGGKYRNVGGYLRGRPLPVGPWKSLAWREVNFAIEILRARKINLDGFVVDILQANSGKYWNSLTMLLNTGAAMDPSFRFMLEPDMAAMSSVSVEELASALYTLSQSPSVYRLADGRLVVAPFYAEEKPPEFWEQLMSKMEKRGTRIALLPVLLNLDRSVGQFATISYGLSSWGQRDPVSFAENNLVARVHQLGAENLKLMAPVTAQDVRPKSSIFWEALNSELFRDEWERAIREHAAYVHLITWNDYSESTEVSPSTGTQFVFYDLAAYYAIWFKAGGPPKILRDAIYYTHRRQIERIGLPPNPADIPMQLLGKTPVRNQIEMLGFLTEPAEMEIEIAKHRYKKEFSSGLAVLNAPAEVGRPIFRILRAGATVLEKVGDWMIDGHPENEDPDLCRWFKHTTFLRSTNTKIVGPIEFICYVRYCSAFFAYVQSR